MVSPFYSLAQYTPFPFVTRYFENETKTYNSTLHFTQKITLGLKLLFQTFDDRRSPPTYPDLTEALYRRLKEHPLLDRLDLSLPCPKVTPPLVLRCSKTLRLHVTPCLSLLVRLTFRPSDPCPSTGPGLQAVPCRRHPSHSYGYRCSGT